MLVYPSLPTIRYFFHDIIHDVDFHKPARSWYFDTRPLDYCNGLTRGLETRDWTGTTLGATLFVLYDHLIVESCDRSFGNAPERYKSLSIVQALKDASALHRALRAQHGRPALPACLYALLITQADLLLLHSVSEVRILLQVRHSHCWQQFYRNIAVAQAAARLILSEDGQGQR